MVVCCELVLETFVACRSHRFDLFMLSVGLEVMVLG